MNSKTYIVRTLGCKANLNDGQQIEARLQQEGYAPAGRNQGASLCIVNSCSVTDEADRQSKKLAEKLARLHPEATIVMTGCSAEIDPHQFTSTPGLHYVVSNREKNSILELLEGQSGTLPSKPVLLGKTFGYEKILSQHPMDREWSLPKSSIPLDVSGPVRPHQARTRAFVKIQEGCNSFCTFCIIPYGRGPSRSVPISELIEEIQLLEKRNIREVILTGTNIGDYGIEWAPKGRALEQLVSTILEQTSLERLRLSSLDPTEITPHLLELYQQSPRLCPHFHVSLQSPSSKILRLMKRKYGFEEVKECLERLASLDYAHQESHPGGVFVGMDLIAGFPGESAEDFEWTYEALKALPWSRLHVFPYSERKGTPATRLRGKVEQSERKRRSKLLHDLSLERMTQKTHSIFTHQKNRSLEKVLLESYCLGPDQKRHWLSGYTPNYLRILLNVEQLPQERVSLLTNQITSLKIDSVFVDRPGGEALFIGTLPVV